YIYLGIYWSNHHHLLHATRRINGAVLWANLHLLFWLSLVPFATSWMSENHNAPVPTAAYGVVLICAGMAYTILVRTLFAADDPAAPLRQAIGSDVKGWISVVLYFIAILMAFAAQWLADAIYVAVALIWLVPDRRIERPAHRS